MVVLHTVLICLFCVLASGSRIFEKMKKISKPTWDQARNKQIVKHDVKQCAGACAVLKDTCNAVHFEASNNTCSLAEITLLEEPPEEEAFPVFMDTQAFKSLEQKENFLLVSKGMAVLRGKIHIYNYETNKCYHRSIVVSGVWDETLDCLTPRRKFQTMTAVGDYILMTGGSPGGGSSLGLIERFDGKNWTTLGKTLSVATYAHCALGISDTETILLGGMNRRAKVDKYDVTGNIMETLPSLLIQRLHPGCGVYKKEIYVAGGFDPSYNPLSAVEVYNMVSRSWRMIASLKSSVVGPSLHTYKGNLALFGNNSIQIYDGVTWAIASESLGKKFIWVFYLKYHVIKHHRFLSFRANK
ncbi:influenza virus NS1A-binding protein homolog isoform X2 [Eurytemora carolleeae]|uniref:influenza virus NS1A-binding protein homolog isoform X2 n=1 Tax=Eurytemora carolleeae TaxID=1294199 RepID=UPI000C777676|nr:influenza virus NS1A-binding protein homolog isoform X2 [Eurytemora carolleeae]|eukprot:XP_023338529.1 influenza virus NS1A-binding protein homolog isoform X2 [Eurytemora affinis]